MTSAADSLAKKLESFAKTLSPEELSMFTGILQPHGQLSDKDLEKASGGAIYMSSGHLGLQSAGNLNATLFRRLLDW